MLHSPVFSDVSSGETRGVWGRGEDLESIEVCADVGGFLFLEPPPASSVLLGERGRDPHCSLGIDSPNLP